MAERGRGGFQMFRFRFFFNLGFLKVEEMGVPFELRRAGHRHDGVGMPSPCAQ